MLLLLSILLIPLIFTFIFLLWLLSLTSPSSRKKNQIELQKREYKIQQSSSTTYYNPTIKNNTQDVKNKENIDYSKFYTKNYVMTPTELNFYRKLKIITDELQLTIFPEVRLESIIKVYNKETSSRNRIKSRSIDFTIVNNNNCKIICCIELDDYSHNRLDRQQRDIFINELFQKVGLKLYRIPVGYYNMEQIEKNIKSGL